MITVTERHPDVTITRIEDGFPNLMDIPRDRAGILLCYDEFDHVLFVGKARKLRSRVKRHLEDRVSPVREARDQIMKISVWFVDDAMTREMLETYFINTKRARYNRDKIFFE